MNYTRARNEAACNELPDIKFGGRGKAQLSIRHSCFEKESAEWRENSGAKIIHTTFILLTNWKEISEGQQGSRLSPCL